MDTTKAYAKYLVDTGKVWADLDHDEKEMMLVCYLADVYRDSILVIPTTDSDSPG